jgi:hypothetical protein
VALPTRQDVTVDSTDTHLSGAYPGHAGTKVPGTKVQWTASIRAPTTTFVGIVPRAISRDTQGPMFPLTSRTVVAAFAQERDAARAIGLISSSPDLEVTFERRDVVGERGEIQLVVLEATLADPAQSGRVASCMVGAHGVRIQPETPVALASRAS